MNVYYNLEGIGDVLIIEFKGEKRGLRTFKKMGDVVQILGPDEEVWGYNIFRISEKKLRLDESGPVELDSYVVDRIEDILRENGFDEKIEVDLTPKVVVGEVVELRPHPNADRLKVCIVDVGDEQLQIVCGAPNVQENQRVVVAKIGAVLPGGRVIKESELRGVPSYGMICSAQELGLLHAPKEKGILVLNTTYQIGTEFQYEEKQDANI